MVGWGQGILIIPGRVIHPFTPVGAGPCVVCGCLHDSAHLDPFVYLREAGRSLCSRLRAVGEINNNPVPFCSPPSKFSISRARLENYAQEAVPKIIAYMIMTWTD